MKTADFKGLLEQLSELIEVQRAAIRAALAGKGSANEAIALIEARFAAAPACGHCKSERFGTCGHASGLGRYKRTDCRRTFNALTDTPLAQLHRRDAWLACARAIADRLSLRTAAEPAIVWLETSFRCCHRFFKAASDKRPSLVTGILGVDETFILKSAKGSRKITGRAPRKRGVKAKKAGLLPAEHDAVLIVRDRRAVSTNHILPDLEGGTLKTYLAPVVAKDAVLVSDGRSAYAQFADGDRLTPRQAIAQALGAKGSTLKRNRAIKRDPRTKELLM